jgi:hypothetical protein
MARAVADTSPLIALNQIDQLGLLNTLFESVQIPPAVATEALSVDRPSWLVEHQLSGPLPAEVVDAGLGAGESEAIALALELRVDRVLLDELPGRALAKHLGLPVIGTLGVLLLAKRRGLIETIREPIEGLRFGRFRASDDLYDEVLRQAGEKP